MVYRIKTEKVSGILSSYEKQYDPGYFWDVSVFKKCAYVAPDMLHALHKLNKTVKDCGGSLQVIDLTRTWEMQAKARELFKKGKKPFVKKPGHSFHNAGRAVDIALELLKFPNFPRDEWLECLWFLAKPLGFRPIISIPDMDMSEAWHFDFPGEDWSDAYDSNSVSYSEVAKCCVLDVGNWNAKENDNKVQRMFIQAQLIRLGFYETGRVDGIFGPKTSSSLSKAGLDASWSLFTLCEALKGK